MENLKQKKCFLLDMDGTIYLGNELIDGAVEFLETLKRKDVSYIFLTNNSSKNKISYVKKLKDMECSVTKEEIFTSGEATIIYLNSIKRGAKIYLMGTPQLEKEFIGAGFDLISGRNEEPDFVVLGFDTTLTYEKIWIGCDYIRSGVKFIATHPDLNCPLEDNNYMPDTGSMIKLFEASTGVSPTVIGKPNSYIIDAIMDKYRFEKKDLVMVGDRLYTDIQVGVNAGITSVLVLSGETTMEDYKRSEIKADYVFPSIKELGDILR